MVVYIASNSNTDNTDIIGGIESLVNFKGICKKCLEANAKGGQNLWN